MRCKDNNNYDFKYIKYVFNGSKNEAHKKNNDTMQTLGGLIKKKEKTKCLPKSARTPLFSMNIFLHTSIQIDKIKLRME